VKKQFQHDVLLMHVTTTLSCVVSAVWDHTCGGLKQYEQPATWLYDEVLPFVFSSPLEYFDLSAVDPHVHLACKRKNVCGIGSKLHLLLKCVCISTINKCVMYTII
jgi:hypothetical protein